MTISIQYFLPEKLTDDIDGGGNITSIEYPDNTSNALFPPIADSDVLGSVHLRKLFVAAVSGNNETLYGTLFYLLKPPTNSAVDIIFASSVTFADTTFDFIEAILSAVSVPEAFYLYGTYNINDQTISVVSFGEANLDYQAAIPGFFYSLSMPGNLTEYVQIQRVLKTQTINLVDNNGAAFTRRLWVLELTKPLTQAFKGMIDIPKILVNSSLPTLISRVYASIPSSYYGIRPLSVIGYAADTQIHVAAATSKINLPSVEMIDNGEVDIFRINSDVMIHNTQNDTLTNPVTAGTTYTLSRDNLAMVLLYDQTGALIPAAQYSVNLAAGSVTMASPMNLAGYTQPLIAKHTLERLAKSTNIVYPNSSVVTIDTIAKNTPYSLGSTNLYKIWIEDSNGRTVSKEDYVADLTAGTVTAVNTFGVVDDELPDPVVAGTIYTLSVNMSYVTLYNQLNEIVDVGYTWGDGTVIITPPPPGHTLPPIYNQPLIARSSNGIYSFPLHVYIIANSEATLILDRALGSDFPANTSYASSVYYAHDLYAHAYNLFSQYTWTSVWSNVLIGNGTTSQYDTLHYPIALGPGCIDGNWAVHFVTTTQVEVLEEKLGNLGLFSILNDISPQNPLTNESYWLIHHEGWGSGWPVNSVLRFKTGAAAFGVWFFRNINSSEPPTSGDSFSWACRGNVSA